MLQAAAITGDFADRVVSVVTQMLFALTLLGALAVVAWRWAVRPSNHSSKRAGDWLGSEATLRDLRWILPAAALWIAGLDGALLAGGFFRQDDFSFLAVAQQEELGSQIWLRHNDHVYPLFRLQVWALVQLGGESVSTAALVNIFNTWTAVVCLALLAAMAWALIEFRVARATLLMAVGVFWSAPGWGEYTSGYFTLNAYLQVLALCFGAAAAALRGGRTGRRAWLAASAAVAAVAVTINFSGLLALGVAGAVLLVAPGVAWPRRLRRLALLALPTVAVGVLLGLFFRAERTARELVQNPRGTGIVETLPERLRLQGAWVAVPFVAAPAGLPLGLVAPPVLQFATDRSRRAGPFLRAVSAGEFVLGAVALLLLARQGRAGRRLTWKVAGAAIATLGALALVVVARGDTLSRLPLSHWNPKYTLYPLAWFVVAAALAFDEWRRGAALPAPRLAACTALVLGGVLAGAGLQDWFERRVRPEPSNYSVRGRAGNLINARQRAADFERVLAELERRAEDRGGRRAVRVPDDAAWKGAFYRRFPSLEWGGDTGPFGVTYLFTDLTAAAPASRLRIAWTPPDGLSAEERQSAFAWVEVKPGN